MHLIVTGLHQRTASLALREQVAFTNETLRAALQQAYTHAHEVFILSTCNRVEIYALIDEQPEDHQFIHGFLAAFHHIDPDLLQPVLYTYTNIDAVHHLCRLAAGLDSLVLGEDQILAQIKDAYRLAQTEGTLGKYLSRLVQRALGVGKNVRTQTGLSSHSLSVVSVALDLARRQLRSLADQRILIIGAGHIAELVLKHLADTPVRSLTLTNRTPQRAETLATRYNIPTIPFEQRESALSDVDLVISCTASSEIVLHRDAIAAITHPLLLVDLAVPRDIDPEVMRLPHVTLLDIDALEEISSANRRARQAEVEKAEQLVQAEVTAFAEWWGSQEVIPTIIALRDRAEEIRQMELARALERLDGLDAAQQEAIKTMSVAIINRLLHTPIVTLRDPAYGSELAPAVRQLFQLNELKRNPHVITPQN